MAKHISEYLSQSPLVQEARRRQEEEERNERRLHEWRTKYHETESRDRRKAS